VSSPYENCVDLDGLDPRLRSYFGEIPAGSIGVGRGVFDVVGTPKRWLWPVLWVLGRQGVVFPAWARDVPFTVTNRPDAGSLSGHRTFHFAGGDRTMVDRIDPQLVDTLGTRGQYHAPLVGEVVDGALRLRSTSLWLGKLRLPGRVEVTERWNDGLQHVAVTITVPVVGRVYEYSGHFAYEIMDDDVLTP
jgi:hypothetical protein